MYLLRRAAVRAVSQQTTRQLSTFRPSSTPRIALLQTSKPTLCRSFHQSRIWRIEEDKKDAEEAREESIEAAEVAEDAAAAAQEAAADAASATTEPQVQEAQEVAEGESSIAANAASSAAAAAAAAAATTSFPPEPRQGQQQATAFPPLATGKEISGAPTRILYIGNLFFEVTAQQLEAEFGQLGAITNSRIVTDARGMSKGFGYVEFADQSSADRAVSELDQKTFQGRRMAVQYHIPRERRSTGLSQSRSGSAPPSKTLFIGNMSYQMSDKDLNDLFREIRDVLDVRVAIDRRSGQPRGFAHADFLDINSAKKAKEILATKVIYGRQLRVDYSGAASQNRREDPSN